MVFDTLKNKVTEFYDNSMFKVRAAFNMVEQTAYENPVSRTALVTLPLIIANTAGNQSINNTVEDAGKFGLYEFLRGEYAGEFGPAICGLSMIVGGAFTLYVLPRIIAAFCDPPRNDEPRKPKRHR